MTGDSGIALITGASSGIGAEFARRLAADGRDLILVARRRQKLEALAEELGKQHSISVEALSADLARTADVQRVEERIKELSSLEILINNAGFGTRGFFNEADWAKQLDMIHVHVLASVRLTRAALGPMIARRRGNIVNVSSLSAFLPMLHTVTYSATKAYLITFSKGLAKELAGTGVRVQVLCPGFTYTEFHDTSEFEKFDRSDISKSLWMSAEDVVAESLKNLDGKRVIVIPGRKNRLLMKFVNSPLGPPLVRLLARKRWE
jgi:short-subunit dehydrogenase